MRFYRIIDGVPVEQTGDAATYDAVRIFAQPAEVIFASPLEVVFLDADGAIKPVPLRGAA